MPKLNSGNRSSPQTTVSEFAQALTIIDFIFRAAKDGVYGCLIGGVKAARLATQDALIYCCRDGVDPKELQDKSARLCCIGGRAVADLHRGTQ